MGKHKHIYDNLHEETNMYNEVNLVKDCIVEGCDYFIDVEPQQSSWETNLRIEAGKDKSIDGIFDDVDDLIRYISDLLAKQRQELIREEHCNCVEHYVGEKGKGYWIKAKLGKKP